MNRGMRKGGGGCNDMVQEARYVREEIQLYMVNTRVCVMITRGCCAHLVLTLFQRECPIRL